MTIKIEIDEILLVQFHSMLFDTIQMEKKRDSNQGRTYAIP